MMRYVDINKLFSGSRRTLNERYEGSKILLATLLSKWYLVKDLIVTKIHHIIMYHCKTCFEEFGNETSDARRHGDRDTNLAFWKSITIF